MKAAAKEEVMRILERLPEDASLEDIQYHIYSAAPYNTQVWPPIWDGEEVE
jgi:hypothetical protein